MKIQEAFISKNHRLKVNTSKTFSNPRFDKKKYFFGDLTIIFSLYQLPGEKFGPGEHVIRYVATDLDDQSAKCEFTISVKRKPSIFQSLE